MHMSINQAKNPSKIDSGLLTEYILFKYGRMSHLKLQKLLYYVQAFHLAYFESPLIDDEFEAWLHGPVSKKVFDRIKDFSLLYNDIEYKAEGETPDSAFNFALTSEQVELIHNVLDEYSQLTGQQLENLTHSELPWIEARKGCSFGDACREVISKTTMAEFYKSQLYGES